MSTQVLRKNRTYALVDLAHIILRMPLSMVLGLLLLLACQPLNKKNTNFDPNYEYKRIVAANIFSAEILWRLGKQSRKKVIAVPAMIDNPLYSSFIGVWPKTITRFHRSSGELVALKPDLVVLAAFNNINFKEILRKAKIDYVELLSFSGFDSYRHNVRLIAKAVADKKQGEALLTRFENRLAAIRQKQPKTARKFTAISYVYGYTMGKNTVLHDTIVAAGLENLAAVRGLVGPQPISIEKLLVWQPDIILTSCGKLSCEQAKRKLMQMPGLQNMKSKLLALPANIMNNVNETTLTISEILQKQIAP